MCVCHHVAVLYLTTLGQTCRTRGVKHDEEVGGGELRVES